MSSVYVVCWIFLQTFQTYFCIQANSVDPDQTAYSRTSMARTSLGPSKIVWDMGSASHWGLFMVPGQETDGDNLGKFFRSSKQKWYVLCSHLKLMDEAILMSTHNIQ